MDAGDRGEMNFRKVVGWALVWSPAMIGFLFMALIANIPILALVGLLMLLIVIMGIMVAGLHLLGMK